MEQYELNFTIYEGESFDISIKVWIKDGSSCNQIYEIIDNITCEAEVITLYPREVINCIDLANQPIKFIETLINEYCKVNIIEKEITEAEFIKNKMFMEAKIEGFPFPSDFVSRKLEIFLKNSLGKGKTEEIVELWNYTTSPANPAKGITNGFYLSKPI